MTARPCRLDQLSAAHVLLAEMTARGCTPTHTTFITLLQTAETHGQAGVALGLLEKMQALGLRLTPQCYAAAIGACAAAGQMLAARRLLADMLSGSKAGLAAPARIIIGLQDKCADWAGAVATYQHLIASGVRPDCATTASVIEALWGAGSVSGCLLALQAFQGACTQGVFRLAVVVRPDGATVEFSLPVGGACMGIIALWRLLVELRGRVLRDGAQILCSNIVMLMGSPPTDLAGLKEAMRGVRACTS